jgi:hypothetical protein
MKEPLLPQQEAQAQQLAHDIVLAAQDEILQIARTLVAADNASLFGQNEFKVRDLALKLVAKAYQQHLEQKKTATTAPA